MEFQLELCVPTVNGEALRRKGDFLCFHWQRPSLPHRARETFAAGASVFIRPERPLESEIYPFLKAARIPEFPSTAIGERCAKSINGILVTLVALWPACQFGLPYTLANAVALGPWINLVDWTMNAFANNGERFVAERLKGMAAWARYIASPCQLYPTPKPLTRFPFSDASGKFIAARLFRGTIASKGSSSRSLLRLSRMSRALPPAGAEIQADSLATHLDLMQDDPPVPPTIVGSFTLMATLVCRNRTHGIEGARVALSNSACFERTRKEGGAMSYLREQLWNLLPTAFYDRSDEGQERFSRPNEGLPMEVLGLRKTFFKLCRMLAFADTYGEPRVKQDVYPGAILGFEEDFPPELPGHNVVSIPDRGGFKARVVTSGPAALQALAHNVRKTFYAQILKNTPTRWALIENGISRFFESLPDASYFNKKWGPWYGPAVLLSSDLTAATDRFPHALIQATNSGIEACLRDDQKICANWCAWKSLSGPQRLIYPDYETRSEDGSLNRFEVESSCGNLMGTAPSWFLLNMFNLTVFEMAWSVWLNHEFRSGWTDLLSLTPRSELERDWEKLRLSVLEEVSGNSFRFRKLQPTLRSVPIRDTYILVGDDLGAVCPYAVSIIYEILIDFCNGRLSQGKHFVQPFQEGCYLLVAEEFAIVRDGKLSHEHIEHLRGIASAQTGFDRRDKRSLWAQIGSTLSSALANVDSDERKSSLLSMAHSSLREWKSTLLKAGMPVYIPTELGGLGWPHPLGMSGGLARTAIRCLRHYRLLRGFRSNPVRFAIEIAKTRACWTVSLEANHLGPLLDLMRGYLESIPVSHDDSGRLASLSNDKPIGLACEAIDGSYPLVDFISELCMEGICLRYLIREPLDRALRASGFRALPISEEDTIVSGAPQILLEVQADRDAKEPFSVPMAAARYRRRCKEILLNTARGYEIQPLSPSGYEEIMTKDVWLLNALHIAPCKQIHDLFPHVCQFSDLENKYVFDFTIVEPHPT